MALEQAIFAVLICTPIYDYVVIQSGAAKLSGFKYQYYPFTRLRVASVALLAIGTFITFFIAKPPESADRWWVAIPSFGAMIVHGIISIYEILRQRRLAKENQTFS